MTVTDVLEMSTSKKHSWIEGVQVFDNPVVVKSVDGLVTSTFEVKSVATEGEFAGKITLGDLPGWHDPANYRLY